MNNPTPEEVIRAWCASCCMPTPSAGDCMALLAALRDFFTTTEAAS